MKIALGLSYDGAGFCGWQSQSNASSVQDALELAISRITQHSVRVHAAGRTDTGVHALMQVIHFETDTSRPLTAWVRGVNAFLPETVRVNWAHVVNADFHARFSARGRRYQYILYNAPVASALMSNKVGWFHLPLDLHAMQQAIGHFVGEHDFSAFRASECQAKSPIRHITQAEISQHGQTFIFNFSANAFLHHQVRNMIGALVYVGKGAYATDHIKTLLEKRNRRICPPTFSPAGLYLTGVTYEDKWGLPNCQTSLQMLV